MLLGRKEGDKKKSVQSVKDSFSSDFSLVTQRKQWENTLEASRVMSQSEIQVGQPTTGFSNRPLTMVEERLKYAIKKTKQRIETPP